MRTPLWRGPLLLSAALFAALAGSIASLPGAAPASTRTTTAAVTVSSSVVARPAAKSPPPLELGRKYYIRSRLKWNKCAEIPSWSKKNYTQADVWTCVNQNNVKWIVTSAGDYAGIDTYYIKNAHSRKCLNVAGSSLKNKAKIIQYTCSSQLNNRWRFAVHGDHWELWNMGTSGFVNIAGGRAVNGARLIQWLKYGYQNQDWFFDLA